MNGRTNVTGGNANGLQIPLDPCTNLRAGAGNGSVSLCWDDPVDKYATPAGEQAQDPQPLISVWDHTVLVRKTGSHPTGPHDGITVVSSSVRNQYQSTPYTDTGLVNDVTYHYGAFAYNTAGLASGGIFTNATPVVGTPLGNQAVGTLVKTPINGTPTEFIVVHQGQGLAIYDDSCDGTWLLLKDIYTTRMWDNSNNDYRNSSIHSYLNETFLNLFDANIKNAIKQVKIPYHNSDGTEGSVADGANGLSCKIFLLSGCEVGLTLGESDFPRDGSMLSYFSSGTGSAANNKRIANYNDSAAIWWLRSPYIGRYNDVLGVHDDGGYYRGSNSNYNGVRPALVLPSDILVDNEMNILAPVGKIAA